MKNGGYNTENCILSNLNHKHYNMWMCEQKIDLFWISSEDCQRIRWDVREVISILCSYIRSYHMYCTSIYILFISNEILSSSKYIQTVVLGFFSSMCMKVPSLLWNQEILNQNIMHESNCKMWYDWVECSWYNHVIASFPNCKIWWIHSWLLDGSFNKPQLVLWDIVFPHLM